MVVVRRPLGSVRSSHDSDAYLPGAPTGSMAPPARGWTRCALVFGLVLETSGFVRGPAATPRLPGDARLDGGWSCGGRRASARCWGGPHPPAKPDRNRGRGTSWDVLDMDVMINELAFSTSTVPGATAARVAPLATSAAEATEWYGCVSEALLLLETSADGMPPPLPPLHLSAFDVEAVLTLAEGRSAGPVGAGGTATAAIAIAIATNGLEGQLAELTVQGVFGVYQAVESLRQLHEWARSPATTAAAPLLCTRVVECVSFDESTPLHALFSLLDGAFEPGRPELSARRYPELASLRARESQLAATLETLKVSKRACGAITWVAFFGWHRCLPSWWSDRLHALVPVQTPLQNATDIPSSLFKTLMLCTSKR